MPLIYVQRYAQSAAVTGGTQTVTTFALTGETVFELDPSTFTTAGTYVLVNYAGGSFTYPGAYATGQLALDALVTVDDDDLIGLTAGSLVDDTVNERITVTLS